MHKIYKTSRGKLYYPKTTGKHSWIDVKSPTPNELEWLQKLTGIAQDNMEDVLVSVRDKDEVPKIEEVDSYHFVLLQSPIQLETEDGEDETQFGIAPIGILYNKEQIITISTEKNDVMDYLKLKLKNYNNNKIIDTSQPQRVILKISLFAAKIYLRYLKQIYIYINEVQNKMVGTPQNKDIMNLMEVGKSLAYFNRSIIANRSVVEKLAKKRQFTKDEIDTELIEDTLDEYDQARDTVKIYDRIVSNTTNTFSNIINNNVNRTVKFLTSLTIILTIPALVANVYGMNVTLPLQNSANAFEIVMAISIGLSFLGILWFYRNRLF